MMSDSMTGLGVAGIFLMIGAVCAIVLLVFMILPGTPRRQSLWSGFGRRGFSSSRLIER